MNLDKTGIIGIVACILGYVAYENYMEKKYPDRFKAQQTLSSQNNNNSSEKISPSPAEISSLPSKKAKQESNNVTYLSKKELTIKNSVAEYVFDQSTGGLKQLRLLNYLNDQKSEIINITSNPMEIYGSANLNRLDNKVAHNAIRIDERSLTFWRLEGPWKISHTYQISENSYGFEISFQWENISSTPHSLTSAVYLGARPSTHTESSKNLLDKAMPIAIARKAILIGSPAENEWFDFKEFCSPNNTENKKSWPQQKIDYFGVDDHYFIKVLIPQSKLSHLSFEKTKSWANTGCKAMMQTYLDQGETAPGESAQYKFKAWFGPKSLTHMEAYHSPLKNTLDFGFFATLSEWLFIILNTFFRFVGNWGLAIIFMTIMIKTLFYPLTKHSAVSMNKMKLLQPEMNNIKERFKDDPTKQQQELMKFMSSNKINPMKGCLPILPTIPVFLAFWRVLSSSIELRHAPFLGWISDLSQEDPYYVTPLLLTAIMIVQQKMTPNTSMDKTQEKIMMIIPLMFGAMSIKFPAGMVLYMLTNTVVSILQQQWLNKKLATTTA